MSLSDDEHKLDYDLTTSIRYDRSLQVDDADGPLPFLLLRYHYERLVQATDLHGWEYAKSVLSYEFLKTMCEKAVQAHEDLETSDESTIRVLLTREGVLTATVMPTKPLSSGRDPFADARFKLGTPPDPNPETVWSLWLDTESTPISLFTVTKTTHREHYDAARARVRLPPFSQATKEDVLLYNPQGEITETSVSNVALWRNGRWLTPPSEAGCLIGTVRRWLLEHHLIEDADMGVLMKDAIKSGDYVLVFNAVAGCRLGKIVN
ncbi:Aminotransferase [Amanita muscaria]